MARILLVLATILIAACESDPRENQLIEAKPSIDSAALSSKAEHIDTTTYEHESAVRFETKEDGYPEDALMLSQDSNTFVITPSGHFIINNKNSVQLNTDLIVEAAYLYQDPYFYYVFFTDTDHEGATSWLQKIEKHKLTTIYTTNIPGFNLGKSIIKDQKAYVTAISHVGRIDLKSGAYDWRHDALYDRKKYSFNSFNDIVIKNDTVTFFSKNYNSKNIDKIIVLQKNGSLLMIDK